MLDCVVAARWLVELQIFCGAMQDVAAMQWAAGSAAAVYRSLDEPRLRERQFFSDLQRVLPSVVVNLEV